jgi:hypothetical protein
VYENFLVYDILISSSNTIKLDKLKASILKSSRYFDNMLKFFETCKYIKDRIFKIIKYLDYYLIYSKVLNIKLLFFFFNLD